jgi:hypothetical protein
LAPPHPLSLPANIFKASTCHTEIEILSGRKEVCFSLLITVFFYILKEALLHIRTDFKRQKANNTKTEDDAFFLKYKF